MVGSLVGIGEAAHDGVGVPAATGVADTPLADSHARVAATRIIAAVVVDGGRPLQNPDPDTPFQLAAVQWNRRR